MTQFAISGTTIRKDYSGSQNEMDPFPGARALLNEVQMDITLSPEEALDHLLGAPIDRFGYSGRDVFRAVFTSRPRIATRQLSISNSRIWKMLFPPLRRMKLPPGYIFFFFFSCWIYSP